MSTQGDGSKARPGQTQRTRRALLAAADEIFAEGGVPTVATVAERADIARATAYRYFPTQEALLLEAAFFGDSEAMRAIPALADEIDDHAERLAEAVRRGAVWTLGREAQLRAIMRASLDPDSRTTLPARRQAYIAQLLAPARDELTAEARERLTASLTLLFGIDPIVSIRDNGDTDPRDIPDVLARVAHELVAAALRDSRTTS